MSVCSSGTSQLRAGMPAAVFVDAAYIKSVLPQPWSWLYDYLPWMHGLEIGNTTTFCAADPPTWTLPTAAEFLAFVTGGPFGYVTAVSDFISDVARAYIWYSLCECSSGPMPGPLTPSSPPSGLPAVNPPGLVSLPLNTPCKTVGPLTLTLASGGSLFGGGIEWNLIEATSVKITVVCAPASGAGLSVTFSERYFYTLTPGTIIRTVNLNLTAGQTFSHVVAVPPGATEMIPLISVGSGAGTELITYSYEAYCGGDVPGAAQTPCCPPDPTLVGLMHQVHDLVTLIQRQSAPFAYVSGSTHTGLSGHGSFTVGQLIGCAVEVTTLPDSYGSSDGTPVERFDLGFVTFGSPDGYEVSRRIDRTSVLHVPPLAGLYTTIGYTLSPGVVATITEIVREP